MCTNMKFCLILLLLVINQVNPQSFIRSTALDNFAYQFRLIRNVFYGAIGRISENPRNMARARSLNLVQKQVPLSVKFPCNVTGFRSSQPPSNVNEVRPGDIDIVAALGDSLTVGNGLVATEFLQVVAENRGLSWSIGGQGSWRDFITLPNILKEFNPNLFGYSLRDSLSHEKDSQFNTAEFGAVSSEMPYMTKVLIQRIKSDRRVDLQNHWKLITLLIGVNNFCLDLCYQSNPENILIYHKKDVLSTLRLLKKNLPRTIVNLVPPPDASLVKKIRSLKLPYCDIINSVECLCMLQQKYSNKTETYSKIIKKWQQLEEDIANMDEFNTEDFTVIYQPFPLKFKFPRTANGKIDKTYLSQDCYHPSQKLNAESIIVIYFTSGQMGLALWNNMMEKPGKKSQTTFRLFEKFLCPSEEEPYIFTKKNS